MKKLSILLFICIFFASCKDESVNFGTVEYYPSFLWEDANISPVTKIMDCDFSLDAQNDANSFAEFQFVDNDGRPVSTSEMQVKVDGVPAKNNVFRVNSKTKSIKLEFTFSPDAETGKHQGYLKLINHELDRLDSHQLSSGLKIDIFQWTLNYDKRMNPLAFVLMWIEIITFGAVLLWLLFLKRMFYPQFRAINKMMIIPNQAPISLRFKGKRMIIIDNQHHKQSLWNRFWTGEIQYIQTPYITTKIVLKPVRRGKQIMFISNATNYICTPNPISMQSSSVMDITNKSTILIQ